MAIFIPCEDKDEIVVIKYFKGKDLLRSELADQVWRFRHKHFVDRFRWEALRKPDGLEIDGFDDDEALHLVLENHGIVVGYSRLLRTDRPHLLSDVYPEIAAGLPYRTGPRIFEWTRCVAEPDISIHGVAAANALLTGVLEFCLCAGIETLIVETHPKLVQILVSHRWDVVPIAAPTLYDGALVLPINAVPTDVALSCHHRNGGITGSLLDLEERTLNPVDGTILTPIIEYAHSQDVIEVNYA